MYYDLSMILIGIYIGIIGTSVVGVNLSVRNEKKREKRAHTQAVKMSTMTPNEVREAREPSYPWGREPIADDPFNFTIK